jgi:hypothetical protein
MVMVTHQTTAEGNKVITGGDKQVGRKLRIQISPVYTGATPVYLQLYSQIL